MMIDMSTTRVSWSEMQRNASKVVRALDDGDVVLERRDGDDVRVIPVPRFEELLEALGASAALARAGLGNREGTEVLLEVFPWAKYLSEGGRREFAEELITSLQSSAAFEHGGPFMTSVIQWRNTAEVRSDPELHARLSAPAEIPADPIPVPRP